MGKRSQEILKSEPKTYDCPYTGGKVSGIGARNCNNSSLDDYSCRYSGCACVAKEGMIEFEQGLAKCIEPSLLTLATREMLSPSQGFLIPEDLKENGGDF